MITSAQLQNCGVPRSSADAWAGPLDLAAAKYGIDSPERVAHWIAQILHETRNLSQFTENLNYAWTSLTAQWPTRFTPTLAKRVGRIDNVQTADQRAIANIAYANRFGNGPPESGDGWKYRGRSALQLTFKDNYRDCGAALGLDLVGNPDLVLSPTHGANASGWFWRSRNMGPKADQGDVRAITKSWNGGGIGLDERERLTAKCLKVFK